MVIRSFRTLSLAPDLISQLGADLLAIRCDKSLPETSINPYNLAFCTQFGAFLLEDQFDPHASLVHSETNRRASLPAVAPKAIHMGGLVDRNRDLRHSRCEDQAQIKRRPFKLFDFHKAIVKRGDLASQQGHRLDLSLFLRANDFFGLLGGALSQTSGDLETIDGAAGDDFISQRGGEILHRPETLDEVVDDIHVEEQKEVKLSDLARIGGGEINA